MNEEEELLDELYIAADRLDNKQYNKNISNEHYKRLIALGLQQRGNRTTLYQAIKFLEEKLWP